MQHKAGFVNIIGNPNVGKSTLMNALVGERLSVITAKAQTTRHRILGIVTGEDYQIVYSDTPGILDPKYLLQKSMMVAVDSAMADADVFLLVTEMYEEFGRQEIIDKLNKCQIPVIVLINKIDMFTQTEVAAKIITWEGRINNSVILPISAKEKFNIDGIIQLILGRLPEAPPFYPPDELTDRSERFFVTEIVRANILEYYKKEVPYCTEVTVDTFEEDEKIVRIRTVIYVARETQKIILIGENGRAMKRLGIAARKELETFFGKQVYLEMFVKVSKDWRDDQSQLKRFGYQL